MARCCDTACLEGIGRRNLASHFLLRVVGSVFDLLVKC